MKINKKGALSIGLTVMTVLLAACGGSNGDTDSTSKDSTKGENQATDQSISVGVLNELSTGDTLLVSDIGTNTAMSQYLEGLYRLDENNQPVPALAEETTVSEDGLTYTFKLREDATWSNGEPVTAHDFVYAWRQAVNPEKAAPYSYMFTSIVNAEEIINGEMTPEELGIEAVGDYEFTVQMTVPVSYFLGEMAFLPFFPQNQVFVEEMGSEYGTSSDTTLYNGPFILTGWDGTNQSWSYQKNEDYWDAKNITLDKIDVQVIKEVSTALNLFESGGLDDAILSGESAKQYVDNEAYVVEPEARTNYLQFNYTDVPMFSNAKLREAFSLILDREELANTILGNGSLPATAFVPHDFVTNPVTDNDFADDAGDFLTYDKEKAKQLFDEAKKELGVDTIEIDLLGDDDEASKLVGQYIQGELQNNFEGLTINLSNVPKNNRIEKGHSGDFDIILGGWGAILPDAINLLDIMNSETTFNVGPYKNEKVDQLLNDAETVNANDPEARWQNMLDAQAIMLNEKGFIPLYHTAEVHLRNPKLKGVEVHSVSARYDYRNAYVAE